MINITTSQQHGLQPGDKITIAGWYEPLPWYKRFWYWIIRKPRKLRVYEVTQNIDSGRV